MSSNSLNPNSFRLPFDVDGKAEPEIVSAIRYSFSGILDLNQAIKALTDKVSAVQQASSSSSSSSSSSGVTQTQATQIAQTQAQNIIASTFGKVNNQTASYTTQSGDYGGLISFNSGSAVVATLNPNVASQWYTGISNLGAGTVTLTPGSGVSPAGTINGAATLAVPQNGGALVWYDGTNWWAIPIAPPSAAGVTSLDGITGAVTLVAGTGITITDNSPAAGDITIAASGGGGAFIVQSASIPINATPDNEFFSASVTVTGAAVGNPVLVCPGTTGFAANLPIMHGLVTAANTVGVTIYYPQGSQSASPSPIGPVVNCNVLIVVFT